MAPVTTKNTSGPTPSDDTFLFVNISGPTDGRHRGPSTQTRIRQHVMRDITKAQRKAPPNRRAKSKKGNSKKKMRHAKTLDASAPEGQSEESRDHESATGSIVSYISGSTIDESTLGTPDRCRTELQKPTPLVDFTLDQHPLTMLYRRLADTSRFPAYSLAYAVTQNVKVNHAPGRSFLFPFAFKEAPLYHRILTGQQVAEIIRSSPEKSIMIAITRFTEVLRCIRKRLSDPNLDMALSDDTIMAVIDSICYSRIPRFPLPATLLPTPPRTGTSAIWDLLRLVKETECQSDVEQNELFDALREVSSIAKTIESELFTRGDDVWHDAVFLGCLVHPVAHRLLSTLEQDCEKQHLPISTSIRLGIALFIIILKQQSRACPAPSSPYVAKAVAVLYWDIPNIPSHKSSILFTLQLWLLLLCTIAYPDTTLLPEIQMMIARIQKQSRLNSWDEVVATARLMPWISKFESRRGFRNYLIDDVE
ncbi:hypothetical protein M431DRAFT_72230 [Trichoderma harzianum CBS 226.95]|uniref:Uncharacterized protein n=1 Tax=Trichoderma harzianum CBS 226.95 TaxID=983964 RepID=A0A2T4ASC9_TRIHA|nr:hypothetical protein M431DRAFT_72230 [Trichoderma harzianum CBS 226.95]PTB59970.1 hypothetical protein M431DRAFT_72230 [Trichoderma harzianum CBS 226.95]